MIAFTIPLIPRSLQFGGKRIAIVPGRYGAKARPRFYRAKSAEEYLASIYALAIEHRPRKPLFGPLEVEYTFVLPRPKNLARGVGDIVGLIRHDGRPDWDNMVKGTQDALSQCMFWHDDGQISDAVVRKRYTEKDGLPRIEVRMRELHVDANILAIIASEATVPKGPVVGTITPLDPTIVGAGEFLQHAAKPTKSSVLRVKELKDQQEELLRLQELRAKKSRAKVSRELSVKGPF
jgi:Holliday junction resolvase RusA-like endonuclease